LTRFFQRRQNAPFRKIKQAAVEQVEASRTFFSHRIDFYGLVQDEAGNPIPGTNVTYHVASSLLEAMMSVERPQKDSIGPQTGADGRFSITGKRGAGIWVTVAHPDYYPEKSRADLDYNNILPEDRPTREKPVEFSLRRKGVAEPLLSLSRTLDVPKDGKPVAFGLASKEGNDILVQVWTDSGPRPYAWRMRIKVPGGGLALYEGKHQFLAPEEGYLPVFDFSMPVEGVNGHWDSQYRASFFVQLPGSRYARMRFEMIAGGDHFAVIESLYNPSGSRNLEFDRNKQIPP
jgi:hypothetical protein